MKLSQKALEDFKKIYFKKSKQAITDEEANTLGVDLLEFMREIYRPIPRSSI